MDQRKMDVLKKDVGYPCLLRNICCLMLSIALVIAVVIGNQIRKSGRPQQ